MFGLLASYVLAIFHCLSGGPHFCSVQCYASYRWSKGDLATARYLMLPMSMFERFAGCIAHTLFVWETNLHGQTKPKHRFSHMYVDSPHFLKQKHSGGADFRRKLQIPAGNHRNPQIGVGHLRFIPLIAAPRSLKCTDCLCLFYTTSLVCTHTQGIYCCKRCTRRTFLESKGNERGTDADSA